MKLSNSFLSHFLIDVKLSYNETELFYPLFQQFFALQMSLNKFESQWIIYPFSQLHKKQKSNKSYQW